jgi:anthranilate phosphoribosyltransferase
MGVFDQSLTTKLAKALQKLGSEHVLVVHGADGMDEISFTGDTFVSELKNGQVTDYLLNPSQFGLATHLLKDIQIQNAEESKAMILDVLNSKLGNQKQDAARDIVLMNAGAAIYVAGIAASLQAGIEKAAAVIDSGAALEKLNQLIARSNQA